MSFLHVQCLFELKLLSSIELFSNTVSHGHSCLAVKAKEKSSDSQWLRSVVSSGTLKDKVAALTIQVQVSFFKK